MTKTLEETKVVRSAVVLNGEVFTLEDHVNKKGRVVYSELYDAQGDLVFDQDLLEQAQGAVDVCIEL